MVVRPGVHESTHTLDINTVIKFLELESDRANVLFAFRLDCQHVPSE